MLTESLDCAVGSSGITVKDTIKVLSIQHAPQLAIMGDSVLMSSMLHKIHVTV